MPKLVDHDARRAEIAAAAADAIDEQGLDRVRLVDVARRASCTTGAVSHYFPGKDAVLEAALDWAMRGYLTRSKTTNREYVGEDLSAAAGIGEAMSEVIFDAQTSGGLLLAVDSASDAAARLEAAGCLAADIGVVEERGSHALILE